MIEVPWLISSLINLLLMTGPVHTMYCACYFIASQMAEQLEMPYMKCARN